MSIATDLIRTVAHDIHAEWLDGCYFAAPDDHTGTSPGDWHLKLDDNNGPGQVFVETTTGHRYRIEMRVTKL